MKKIFSIFTVLLITSVAFGQHKYDELLIIKASGNWDKLIKRAEKYTNKSSTHKDPAPYFYLAYGLYKISYKANRDEIYKNAYKDSYSAIGKMIRYDEAGAITSQHQKFIDKLKQSLLEVVQNDVAAGQPRRAFGWAMRFYKFGREYIPALYLDAALRYAKRDRTTARFRWEKGKELLKKADVANWSQVDKDVFMYALYLSAKFLKKDLQNEPAKKMMNIGAPYFEGNPTWNKHYDEIVNS